MGRINILDIDTVNKISAGEVVERPASAVKEMIENSVDAGADKITVEIKNGGISFIRITDNGCGIDKDDVEKVFLPHSTSKIKSIDDLSKIYTMGFRGEALASISSVAKVELLTKTKEEEFGTVLNLAGGKIISKDDAGCPDGTTIIVSDLFYNTPARMKFLKKDTTEAAYIGDIVDKMIIGNPGISIKFINNGRIVRNSPGNGNLKDALSVVYGRDVINSCVDVNYDLNGVKVYGLAGLPHNSRPNRYMQLFYVNGRTVKSKTITFAGEQAYNTMMMNGKYPVMFLFIDVDASQIDVNVHPIKMEIKFSNEKAIHDAVFWGVQNAVLKSREVKEVKVPEKSAVSTYKSEISNYQFKDNNSFEIKKLNQEDIKPEEFFTKEVVEFFKPVEQNETQEETAVENVLHDAVNDIDKYIKDYKVIGQIFDSYIIVEQNDKMLLIDQHAAHERINFNHMSANKTIESQVLVYPEIINVSVVESDIILNNADIFERTGFEIENFGENKFIVRRAPFDVETEFIESLVHQIINVISKNGSPEALWDEALFTIACKRAIKANQRLSSLELEHLVGKVLNDENIKTCPHGRPVVISFDKKFIEKEFKRIL